MQKTQNAFLFVTEILRSTNTQEKSTTETMFYAWRFEPLLVKTRLLKTSKLGEFTTAYPWDLLTNHLCRSSAQLIRTSKLAPLWPLPLFLQLLIVRVLLHHLMHSRFQDPTRKPNATKSTRKSSIFWRNSLIVLFTMETAWKMHWPSYLKEWVWPSLIGSRSWSGK